MARDCYSGEFAFDDGDDEGPRMVKQRESTVNKEPSWPAGAPGAAAAARLPPLPVVPLPLPTDVSRQLLYIKSARLDQLSRMLPVNQDRSLLVHSLVEAYGLLEGAEVAEAQPASAHQLQDYHSRDYLRALVLAGSACQAEVEEEEEKEEGGEQGWSFHLAGQPGSQLELAGKQLQLSERQAAVFGLEDDCAPFPGLYEYAALVAGGSLQAAAALCAGACRLAVHLDGGRHHAAKSKAAGFCYVNDVVLAILQLLGSFRRILYLDLDIHHGDAVEDAFLLTPRVLTLSLHKHAPGFYPGTGAAGARGQGGGAGFALNLPLGDGLRDGLFEKAFAELAGGAVALFDPDCVVMQCGVDGLAHDPLADSWALTPAAYAACAKQAAAWGRPLLVLGGGGYDAPSAACTWALVLAALLGRQLPDDVPEHEHFERYGPAFTLSSVTKRLLPPDTNNEPAVLATCHALLDVLRTAVARTTQPGTQQGSGGGGGGSPSGQPSIKRARAS